MAAWLFAILFLATWAATYSRWERRGRARWARDVGYGSAPRVALVYRGIVEPAPRYFGRAPRPTAPLVVRMAALLSIGLGQLVVPGLVIAVAGSRFYGAGLLALPVLLMLAQAWWLGPALLRADPRAPARARRLSRFILILSGVGLPLLFIASLLHPPVFFAAMLVAVLPGLVSLILTEMLRAAAGATERSMD